MAQRYIDIKCGKKTVRIASLPHIKLQEQENHSVQSARAFLAVKETSNFLTEVSPSG